MNKESLVYQSTLLRTSIVIICFFSFFYAIRCLPALKSGVNFNEIRKTKWTNSILSAARILCTQVLLIITLNNICHATFFYELCMFVKALKHNRINAVSLYKLRGALRHFCEHMDRVDNAFMDDINTFCMLSISN